MCLLYRKKSIVMWPPAPAAPLSPCQPVGLQKPVSVEGATTENAKFIPYPGSIRSSSRQPHPDVMISDSCLHKSSFEWRRGIKTVPGNILKRHFDKSVKSRK
jgi:hypothetical protein